MLFYYLIDDPVNARGEGFSLEILFFLLRNDDSENKHRDIEYLCI